MKQGLTPHSPSRGGGMNMELRRPYPFMPLWVDPERNALFWHFPFRGRLAPFVV